MRASDPHRARAAVVLGAALSFGGLAACGAPAPTPPEAVGPAGAYVELVLGGGADEARQQAVRFEESVAACMADAGFEYVPNLGAHGFVAEADVEHPPGTREFAERYGYGYAGGGAGTMTLGPDDDPNAPLLAAMSEAELAAYDEAMAGEMGLFDGGEADWERSGCYGRAMLEVYRSGAVADPTYLALADELERIETEVLPRDDAVAQADAAWSACMSDAGHPGLARRPDAEARALEQFQAAGSGGGEVGDELDARVATLAAAEVELATADWQCADETGYDAVVTGVRDAAEQEYVDAHRAELDALVERWGDPDGR